MVSAKSGGHNDRRMSEFGQPADVQGPSSVESRVAYVDPYSSLDGRYPLTAEAVRYYDRDTLIRRMAYAIKNEGWVPTADEVKSILCLGVLDYYDDNLGYYEFNQSREEVSATLPWPVTGGVSEPTRYDDGISSNRKTSWVPIDRTLDTRIVHTELGDLRDDRDGEDSTGSDAVVSLLDMVIDRVDNEGRVELVSFLVENFSYFYDLEMNDNSQATKMFDLVFRGVDPLSDLGLNCGRAILEGIRLKEDQYNQRDRRFVSDPTWALGVYSWHLNRENRDLMLLRALARAKQEQVKVADVIGILLKSHDGYGISPDDLPALLNRIRGLADTISNDQERNGLIDLLREILSLTTDSGAHTSLEGLYSAIRFEEYPITTETRKFRTDMLEGVFDRFGIDHNNRVIDIACGTGWLVNDLVESGYIHTYGVDSNMRHLNIANQDMEGRFVQGDWHRLPFGGESVDCAINMGRSLPHVENSHGFDLALREMNRVLRYGGIGVIDMPDPTQGEYQSRLQAYRSYLSRYGLSDRDLEQFWFEVSSPDGQNFYNRYIPPREAVRRALVLAGFEIVEEVDEDIPGTNGDRNVVFVFRKIADSKTGFMESISVKH